jgi:hypothetical protein
LSLLSTNVVVTPSNLFIRDAFLDVVSGLRIYNCSEDWELGPRASLASEPVMSEHTRFENFALAGSY